MVVVICYTAVAENSSAHSLRSTTPGETVKLLTHLDCLLPFLDYATHSQPPKAPSRHRAPKLGLPRSIQGNKIIVAVSVWIGGTRFSMENPSRFGLHRIRAEANSFVSRCDTAHALALLSFGIAQGATLQLNRWLRLHAHPSWPASLSPDRPVAHPASRPPRQLSSPRHRSGHLAR